MLSEDDLKIHNYRRCTWQSHGSVSCFNSARKEQTQVSPFYQSPTSFSCHLLVILCHWSQPKPCFELSSLLPSNHELPDSSELIYWSGGCHQLPAWSTCICTSYTYLSLGFYFHHDNVALESMGQFSESWLSRSERVSHFWKMQNQCCGHTLFQVMQKPSQDEWGKPWMPWKPP